MWSSGPLSPRLKQTPTLESNQEDGRIPGLLDLSPALISCLASAQRIGAIGPAPLEQHIRHALGFAQALAPFGLERGRFVDLGSGGGIPGLVMAEAFPLASFVLLEGRTMRCEFLRESVDDLGFDRRVSVLAMRAEEAGRLSAWRAGFDVAVARGFAGPAVTAECAAPLLRAQGLLCVSEPPGLSSFERWPADACGELGLEPEARVENPNSFVILRQQRLCDERYPRRVGVPSKRPLF